MEKARVQHPAPEFKGQAVIDGQFKEISLEDYKGKWLVFFFYPLDFTFVCPTEIIAFSDKIQQFKDINCEVSYYNVFYVILELFHIRLFNKSIAFQMIGWDWADQGS